MLCYLWIFQSILKLFPSGLILLSALSTLKHISYFWSYSSCKFLSEHMWPQSRLGPRLPAQLSSWIFMYQHPVRSPSLLCFFVVSWILRFAPLLWWSYHFDYCSFVLYFEIRACDTASFVLSQACFAVCALFWFHTNFRIICPSSVKNTISILIGIALK